MQNGKRLVNESLSHSLSEQLAAEARSFAACSASDDFAEGVQAFLDKRQPQFGGAA
jgi:2-(1,2-epoxy-1,2-dihydrophenyl)acetyl-CoA isomerase